MYTNYNYLTDSLKDCGEECLLWPFAINKHGYGTVSQFGQVRYVYIIAYEHAHGPVPTGTELDHLCKVRHCFNPKHLEAVTHAENVKRGDSGLHHRIKTHCPNGHPYAGDNLYIWNNHRKCRTCLRAASLACYYKNKEQ